MRALSLNYQRMPSLVGLARDLRTLRAAKPGQAITVTAKRSFEDDREPLVAEVSLAPDLLAEFDPDSIDLADTVREWLSAGFRAQNSEA